MHCYSGSIEMAREFVKIGFLKDKKFSSHLTIGRMKSPKNKNKVK